MEIQANEVKTKIIPFPKQPDLTMANWAQEKYEIAQREKAAIEYSEKCAREPKEKAFSKDDVLCFLSCVSLMGFVASIYFLGIIFG